jgi:hypothetical protein
LSPSISLVAALSSNCSKRERIFLRWLENVERLLDRHVDRDAAYKVWRDGYSVREYAGEVAVPQLAPR